MDHFSKIVSSINSEIDTNNIYTNKVVQPLSPPVKLKKRFTFESTDTVKAKNHLRHNADKTSTQRKASTSNDIQTRVTSVIYVDISGNVREKKTPDSLCFHKSHFKQIYEERFGQDILTFDTYNSEKVLKNMEDAWIYSQLKNAYSGKRLRK